MTITPPKNLTKSPKKGTISRGNFIFQPSIFRGYVNLQKGILAESYSKYPKNEECPLEREPVNSMK